MFLLKCPGCQNKMKYQNRDMHILKKSKRCVYCGKTFNVHKNIVEKISN